jgi:glutaredoxin-like YruB-family protein
MEPVKLYSTPFCPACGKARELLDREGIKYQTIDISLDRSAVIELVKKTRQMNVPVVQVGGSFIIGFDKERILALIRGDMGSEHL